CAIAKKIRLLYGPPEGRALPPSAVGVVCGEGVAEPLQRGVRPQARKLIEEQVGVLDAELLETFPLVAELDPCHAGFSVPAVGPPDFLHPVLARDSDLFGFVVDHTGVRSALAELVASAASAGHVQFQRGTDKLLLHLVFVLTFGMRLAAMPSGDE